MTTPEGAETQDKLYFYLSYARSAPLANDRTDIDHWVRMLYQDLSAEIRRQHKLPARTTVGFFDGLVPAGADWAKSQTEALSSAEVFIPLYSPAYLIMQWSLRERESFRRRLAVTGLDGARHVLPVLWIPFPASTDVPEVAQALEIGKEVSGYRTDGLRALLMLSAYKTQYRTMIGEIAERVVQTVQQQPIGRSAAPAIADLSEIKPRGKTPYVVGVVAPTHDRLPADAPADSYGKTSLAWRPFGTAQAQPIAVYASTVAERLGLPTRTLNLLEGDKLERDLPGVLLIDPWILAVESGEALLRSILRRIDGWTKPLIVVDTQRKARGVDLSNKVAGMLSEFDIPSWSLARQVDEFVDLMPAAVSETRRLFLRDGPVYPPDGPPVERGRLADDPIETSQGISQGKRGDQ